MGSNWKTTKLLDHYDIRSGLSKPAKDFGSGHPFLTFKDVFYNYFTPDELGDLVQSNDKERENCSVKRGDVFLTRTSETMHELGMSCVALQDYENATFNGFCKRLRPHQNSELVPEYVGYYLRSTKFRQSMLAFSTMSTRASLNNEMIGRLEISYPPEEEQIEIARVLKNLDDKITLNRQINQTLEQMAQALFKSWFVDFDPVVDNALDAGFFEQDLEFSDELLRRAEFRKAARESSDFKPLSNDIRQQFPAAFEECVEPSLGLEGWIPKGWQAGELGDVLLLRNERIKPSSETKRIPYVPIECIGTKEPLLSKSKSGEEANSSLILFKEGDILFGAMRPYFHKVCIAPFNGVTRSTVFTLTAKDSESLYFSFFQAYQESTVEYATLHCEGSTIPYAKWKGSLDRKPIVLPTKEVQHLFHQRVKSFIEWGNSSNEQSQSLLKVRDTLLPKLISGELRLDEIETELVS
ncbi:restriction endonuclease subunit S [Enterobacter ludwigii]|uniref:restriction endonuclease subunit S n=1 Tax=Enterobacteriaceae TaxID=543 RepID=UPI00125CF99D|nr:MULTISPECIES: restriction endonuclease subunit S [Enterobacteriaceae]ELY2043319.1 restriction endonuclease subunit S [Enterobacter ludwigii]KAB5482009.1 restriction endonuclease subunit S [Enterobacter sp. 198]MBV0808088.1 restriction endonuclease subunit S [Escherichia coli]MBV0831997.1 restriction endonuclease subunit S [Escherichia coli]MBV0869702.1 restriction endonuclease subunit S [Escherichia coli]